MVFQIEGLSFDYSLENMDIVETFKRLDKKYTRNEWGRCENYTRNEWRRSENYTRNEWRRCETSVNFSNSYGMLKTAQCLDSEFCTEVALIEFCTTKDAIVTMKHLDGREILVNGETGEKTHSFRV